MKILLVNPPQTFYKNSQSCVEQLPLGILYIAAVLKKEGVDVEVLDALREGDNLLYNGENIYYGLSWDDIARQIRIRKPDIVGISNPYSSQLNNAVTVANITKNIDSRIITVLGGVHPTVAGLDLINNETNLDICVRGMGEYVMRELVKGYFIKKEKDIKDIPGLIYRYHGAAVNTGEPEAIEDLDKLPPPAYEMLDMKRYLSVGYKLKPELPLTTRVIEMITSRGCPYSCIFCSVQCVMGNKWRAHSPEYVLSHIEYIIHKYKVEYIRFNDDNISLNRHRFDAILSGIIKRNIKFKWSCPNGVRADTLDEAILEKMKKAGCEHIFIAAESGNQEIINKVICKHTNLSYVEKILKLCNKIGVQADVYFIFGLPGETLKTMRQTQQLGLKFLAKYNVIPYFFIATPLPGTKLLKICRENGYLKEDINPKNLSVITQGKAIIHTDKFTTNDVNALLKEAIRKTNMIRNFKYIILLFRNPFSFFKKGYRRMRIIAALR